MFGIFTWRFVIIEQDFDNVNYIPSDTYAYAYLRGKESYFDQQGIATKVFCGKLIASGRFVLKCQSYGRST